MKRKLCSANISAILPSELQSLDMDILKTLGGRASEAMKTDQQMALFDRFKAANNVQSMRRVLENVRQFSNMSQLLTAVAAVRNKLPAGGRANDKLMAILMEQLADRLGHPAAWTTAAVDQLNQLQLLRFIPTDLLLAINQSQVMDRVPTLAIGQKAQFAALNGAEQKRMTALILHKKVLQKPVSEWSVADILAVQFVLGLSPPDLLHRLNASDLYTAFTRQQPTQEYGLMQADIILDKLIEQYKEVTPKLTLSNANIFLKKLGSLAAHVSPDSLEMLVDAAYHNQTEGMKSLYRTVFSQGDTSQRQKCRVFKRTYAGSNMTQLTTADITVLLNDKLTGCVPKNILDVWLQHRKVTLSKLAEDVSFQSKGKLRSLARRVARGQYSDSAGRLDLATLPAKFMEVINVRDIKSATWSELSGAKAKLKEKSGIFTNAQKAMIIRKGLQESDAAGVINADMGAQFNDMLPVSSVESLTADIKKKAATGTPANSALRMLSALSPSPVLPDQLTAASAGAVIQPGLPHITPDNLLGRIDDKDVLSVMESINMALIGSSEDWPSRKMCRAMKKRVAEFAIKLASGSGNTGGDSNDLATLQMEDRALLNALSASDFSTVLPSCVIAEIRPEMVEKYASAEQRIATLISLGSLSRHHLMMTNKDQCHRLTQLGVSAMSETDDITATDAEKIGMAAVCLDPSDILRLNMEAFEILTPMFENSACLNVDQANAIQQLIMEHYGTSDTWLSLEPFCSLLSLLDDALLRTVRFESLLDECSEDILSADGSGYSVQSMCRRMIGDSDADQMQERQLNLMRRYSTAVRQDMNQLDMGPGDSSDTDMNEMSSDMENKRRKRRQTANSSPLSCAVVEETAQGMLPWSVDELRTMSAQDVQLCQAELTRLADTDEKSLQLWNILKQAYNGADRVPLHLIGRVAAVIPVADINTFTINNDTQLAPFGVPMPMSRDQLRAVVARLTETGWPPLAASSGGAAALDADSLLVLGQCVCGMTAQQVRQIRTEQISMLLKVLSPAYWCDPAVIEVLAMKAVNITGDPASWTNADVADYGAVVGGLSEQQLSSFSNESLSGLTVAGVKSISPTKIAALTSRQVQQLAPETAASLSDQQLQMFTSEMMLALQAALLQPTMHSSATTVGIISVGFLVTSTCWLRLEANTM